MTSIQILFLSIALLLAIYVGAVAYHLARRNGTSPPGAVLIGGGAAASFIGLYLAGVGVYG
ncbi:hypothetical protein ACH4UR_35550 [Streptomyces lydicus]|uniref:hypothetical protein n=1 Tax=Streptomyces lydicus TaxID=47763 RepID=UPI0033C59134